MNLKRIIHLSILSAIGGLAALPITTSANAEEKSVSISGFFDTQYQYKKKAIDPGFILNDGALYLSAEYDRVKGKVDLPFSGAIGENSSFNFAKGKAQAYLAWAATDGIEITVGQFDTIYGFELNDSKDIVFTTPGVVFANFLPTTHLGGMVGYSSNGISLKGLVSNASNKSQAYNIATTTTVTAGTVDAPTTTTSTEYPEFGAMIGYSNEMMRASAGMLHHQRKGTSGANNLYSILVGATFDPITVDAEFDLRKIGSTPMGFGGLLHLVVAATDKMSFGARTEYLKKVPAGSYEVMNGTFGPQYAFNEHLKFKADYTFNSVKAVKGGSRAKEHAMNAAALFMF